MVALPWEIRDADVVAGQEKRGRYEIYGRLETEDEGVKSKCQKISNGSVKERRMNLRSLEGRIHQSVMPQGSEVKQRDRWRLLSLMCSGQ